MGGWALVCLSNEWVVGNERVMGLLTWVVSNTGGCHCRRWAFVSAGDVAGVSCHLVVSKGEGVGGLVLVYSPGLCLMRAVVVVNSGICQRR